MTAARLMLYSKGLESMKKCAESCENMRKCAKSWDSRVKCKTTLVKNAKVC
jgi:hypothetical protein